MRWGAVFLAVAAAMLPACDRAVSLGTEAHAEAPEQQAGATAKADPLKLKTGELLGDSSYGQTFTFGGGGAALLTVEFRSPAEPALREESIQELVTQRLLTAAMRDGHRKAHLWVKRSKSSVGPLSVASNDDWAFERGEGRQWRQTSGPKTDWSIVVQDLAPNPALSLNVAQKFIQTRWDSGAYRLEMHAVAFPELSPEAAIRKAAQVLANITACDSDAAQQPDYLSDDKLNAVIVYVYPEQRQDLLHIVPFVHVDIGRTDGRWTCDRQKMLDEIESMNWRKLNTWDALIR